LPVGAKLRRSVHRLLGGDVDAGDVRILATLVDAADLAGPFLMIPEKLTSAPITFIVDLLQVT
jgi:hypothetical protein